MPKLRKKPNEEKAKKFNALLLERTEILGIERWRGVAQILGVSIPTFYRKTENIERITIEDLRKLKRSGILKSGEVDSFI